MFLNKLYTIGQFAALHEINKKTLMWYDEIGLLKPAVVRENGYRYYTCHQSSILETILLLRELNVSLREIQDFMENRSPAELERLLGSKIEELDHTISHLQATRQLLLSQRQDMVSLLHIDLSQISIVEKEKSYLATVNIGPGLSPETEIEMMIAEAKKHRLRHLHDASYGSMLDVKDLYAGKFTLYSALFMVMPKPVQKKGLHICPAGKYLRAFCKGSWDKLPEKYQELLDYAQRNGLTLYGYSYEMGINEMVIDSIDDYITKIEIPIRE